MGTMANDSLQANNGFQCTAKRYPMEPSYVH